MILGIVPAYFLSGGKYSCTLHYISLSTGILFETRQLLCFSHESIAPNHLALAELLAEF